MGNNYVIFINNTTQEMTIKEWKKKYCKDLKKIVEFSTDEGENLGPGKHSCFSPSKLKKSWKKRQRLMGISSEYRVSLKGENSNKGLVLLVIDFESNVAIVFNMGKKNQLVKVPVSREEMMKNKETKISRKHEELKRHLTSIVNKRNTASTTLPQLGEGEEFDLGSKSDVSKYMVELLTFMRFKKSA